MCMAKRILLLKCLIAFQVRVSRIQIMFFCFLKGIGVIGNYISKRSLNTFKSLIQCGIAKHDIIKKFTLIGHKDTPEIYEYYLKYFRNDTDLYYGNQANSTQVFCQ
jgi:ERCC4-type nuclease